MRMIYRHGDTAADDGARAVLAHQAEHPLAGNPDVATDPKPSPTLR